MTDANWPTFCAWFLCNDPSLPNHHHHRYLKGQLRRNACTCGNIDQPGTRPKDK